MQAVQQGLCPAAPPEEAHALRAQHGQALLLRDLPGLLQGTVQHVTKHLRQ